MAQSRSSLASYGLDKAHVSLTSAKAARTRPAASQLQEPPSDIPSLARRAKATLVNYPCRLRADQIAALNSLKTERGVLPAELIRDAVDLVLRRIEEEG